MSVNYDVSVFVGRCQPVHKGHIALLSHALGIAPHLIVVLGSARAVRSAKNPFRWEERAEMIRRALPAADRARVSFMPVRDYYDLPRWVSVVQADVQREAERITGLSQPRIAVVGHHKDASSSYLSAFQGWASVNLPRAGATDGVSVRDRYFGGEDDVEAALAGLATELAPATVDDLRAFAGQPAYHAIAEEWRMLRGYKASWSSAPYPPIFVTVDALVECADHVLLIQRGLAPGKGSWALPGGFLEQHDTTLASALRELHEETGVVLDGATLRDVLKQREVFDHPERSQRGRTITHAFHFVLPMSTVPDAAAGDDASQARWVRRADLLAMEAEFHDDHFHILDKLLRLNAP